MPDRPQIILAGGSGFLGAGLTPRLVAAGYDVTILTRGDTREGSPVRHLHWDARTPGDWSTALDGAAAIVNLVGRTVDCRKTPAHRREILESRVDSVRALAAAYAACKQPPPVWIQSSTAHIYGDTADEILDESSPIGAGFAPTVGVAWERALHDAFNSAADDNAERSKTDNVKSQPPPDAAPAILNPPSSLLSPHPPRRVVLRTSFVLGRDGGALPTLARLARLFLGGRTGTGRQYMSWIHETDLHNIILRALTTPAMHGVYVVTAPNPVTNDQFMRQLRAAVHRPWSPPVPAPIVRLGAWLLRTDPELALLGRRCVPTRLLREGFEFRFPELREALRDLTDERRGIGALMLH